MQVVQSVILNIVILLGGAIQMITDSGTDDQNDTMNFREPIELFKLRQQDLTVENTPEYHPDIKLSKIIKINDSNSITIATLIDNFTDIYRFTIEFSGITTPMTNIKKDMGNEEVKAAELVIEKLNHMLLNKFVILKNLTNDKVKSSILRADVYLYDDKTDKETDSINEMMVENHFAVKTGDGIPNNWVEYMSKGQDTKGLLLKQSRDVGMSDYDPYLEQDYNEIMLMI